MSEAARRSMDWVNTSFLAVVHGAGVVGTGVNVALSGVSLQVVVAALLMAGMTIFAISAGYHRLFSHRSYQAHPAFRLLLLLFGAAAFQTSALEWAGNHRRHHAETDTHRDPYSVRAGFWHAHVGWVLRKVPRAAPTMALRDLRSDPLVMWQHRNFVVLATLMSFGLPLFLGVLWGDLVGFLLMVGFARLVFVYHATFSINSLAHMLGSQPYSTRDSSRDSFLIALFTSGEGYHNFHHTFPSDYRNGVLAHQWDPTKWILFALNASGLVNKLRRTASETIRVARVRRAAEARHTNSPLTSGEQGDGRAPGKRLRAGYRYHGD